MDFLKLHYLEKLITEAGKNSQVIMAISPTYQKAKPEFYDLALNPCKRYGIQVLNHLQDPAFMGHEELFNDNCHLNSIGADKYTSVIVRELKALDRQSNPARCQRQTQNP